MKIYAHRNPNTGTVRTTPPMMNLLGIRHGSTVGFASPLVVMMPSAFIADQAMSDCGVIFYEGYGLPDVVLMLSNQNQAA
jgi:hypothetical protein